MSSLTVACPADDSSFRPIAWAEFRNEVLALYAPPLRARETQRRMTRVLDAIGALGVETTAELTPALVARFIGARPRDEHPNTTHGLVSTLRAACNYAAGQRYCAASPFATRRKWVRTVTPKAPEHHSREEIARVLALAAADVGRKTGWAQWRARRLHALVATVAYTGLRKSEALHLRVEDLDLDAGMLLVVARAGSELKTDAAAQPVPMPTALVEILRGWLPHLAIPEDLHKEPRPSCRLGWDPTRIDPGWVFPCCYRTGPWLGGSRGGKPLDRLKRLGKRAGLAAPLTFQSLRHSWATHAEFWGLSDAQIQRVMRHTNTRTQWRYRHADKDNLREIVSGIGFGPDAGHPTNGPAAGPTLSAEQEALIQAIAARVAEMLRGRSGEGRP
jgi:integrase